MKNISIQHLEHDTQLHEFTDAMSVSLTTSRLPLYLPLSSSVTSASLQIGDR